MPKVAIRPPAGAIRFAELGLDARAQARRSRKCCTSVGLARGRAIARGKTQDATVIRAWFRRHRGNYEKARARAVAEGLTLRQAAPSEPAIQAWWLWGGDPMWAASERAVVAEGRRRNPNTPLDREVKKGEKAGLSEYDAISRAVDMWPDARDVKCLSNVSPRKERKILTAFAKKLVREGLVIDYQYHPRTSDAGATFEFTMRDKVTAFPLGRLHAAYVDAGLVPDEVAFVECYDDDYRGPNPRQPNPVPLVAAAGVAVASALVGSALTASTLGGNPPELTEIEEIPRYKGAILIFPKSGWVGEVIDRATGRHGYDHVGLDLGWMVEGKPVHVESMRGQGVRLVDPETYNREPIRIPITATDTTYARGVAESLLRDRTRYRGRSGGIHCGEFVIRCLPRKWRKGLPRNPTPNELAKAWIKTRRKTTKMAAPEDADA